MIERTDTFQSDNVTIAVDCYEPPGEGRFPTVVALHGSGGFTNGAATVRNLTRPIVALGYAVYIPHYFDRTGTVRSDFETSRRHFSVWMRTIGASLGYVERQPACESSKLGVLGISLGGFLALAVASLDERLRAAVSFFGGFPEPFASNFDRMPPTLIVHGDEDPIVPVEEAHKAKRLLDAVGIECELKTYPREGHLLSPLAALDAARRTVGFLGRHLRDS